MKNPENVLSDREMERVSLLMQDYQNTGDIQSKLKRLFAATIKKMLEAKTGGDLDCEKHSVEGNK